ncbi:GNAT family N-acetyltransferase [Aestuariibacter sp. GS-14]|uniref:GNAT family N-acetyltransferase n=1 Tax=Alteromonadaceae TaxID=72275 RepID=UPI001127F795|nr:GNAT family N-acetyltransferase [Aestuariibacter sp. GS-14]TPV54094.1 GNAT family N-acetyltransferase [Aestuariibacter sp. GS-14]
MTCTIRPAVIDDTATILHFIRELAIYEKAEDEAKATPQHVHNTLFCDNPKAHAIICELNGEPVGFAVYFFSYSTWQGQYGIYLEDLYVSQSHRGIGAGKLLLTALAKIAVDNQCGRFEWSVLDWNQPAIDFYESLGAKPQSEWIKYRLDGQALLELAAKA